MTKTFYNDRRKSPDDHNKAMLNRGGICIEGGSCRSQQTVIFLYRHWEEACGHTQSPKGTGVILSSPCSHSGDLTPLPKLSAT